MNNFIFFKKIKQVENIWVWVVLWSLISFSTLLGGSYLLFKTTILNEKLTVSDQPSGILSTLALQILYSLRENHYLLWSLLFFIIFINAIISGIASSKWQLQAVDRDWLMINLKTSEQKSNIYIYLESLTWNSKVFLMAYVPIILSLGYLLNLTPIKIILILFITFLLFIVLGIISSIFHNKYMCLQRKRNHFLLRLVTNILIRCFLFVLALNMSNRLVPWIKNFPLTSNEIDIEKYYQWMQLGTSSLVKLFEPIKDVITFSLLPNSILATYAMGELDLKDLLISSVILTIFVGFTVLLAFSKSKPSKGIYYPFSFYEKWIVSLSAIVNRQSYITFLIRNDIRTTYFFHRFPILLGPLSFWIQLGIFTSFIQVFEPFDKMYHFILAFYFFFFVFFYVFTMFWGLNGMFSMDSVGKHIILHLLSKKNAWSIFLYKFRLFLITTLPLFIVCDILFMIINQVPLNISIIVGVSHLLFYFLLTIIIFLPSVISPHYNFLNIEQLEDYPDQKAVRNLIRYLTVGIFIPCLMLPIALLMSDFISISQYLHINAIGITVLFLILSGSLVTFIKHKLVRLKCLDDFSL